MAVKTSSGWPTSWSPLTHLGREEVISLSFLGLFLFPPLLLEKDQAAADQFLKEETMIVVAIYLCTIMVSPLRNWSTMAGSFPRRRVGKRKRPRKERLTTSAPPARVS